MSGSQTFPVGVTAAHRDISDFSLTPGPAESRGVRWWRSTLALLIVALLAGLGVANIALRARSHEVEDGVLWGLRGEGVTALEVAPGSAAAHAGIVHGDVLLAVNGSHVRTPSDVVDLERVAFPGTTLSYTLLRLGPRQALEVSLARVPQGNSLYFILAAVGLFTLLVGAFVRLKRPHDPATLHFFWLCVAFFGAFTFSFNGALDRLDWIFYWGDATATALLPPLLLHFTLVFPQRPFTAGRSAEVSRGALGLRAATAAAERVLLPVMYAPALLLVSARILAVARGSSNGPLFGRTIDLIDRGEPVYLFVCTVAAILVVARA